MGSAVEEEACEELRDISRLHIAQRARGASGDPPRLSMKWLALARIHAQAGVCCATSCSPKAYHLASPRGEWDVGAAQ